MRCLKIQAEKDGSSLFIDVSKLYSILDYIELNETQYVTLIEMSEKKFKELPEFSGF